jgi:ribonuclease HII
LFKARNKQQKKGNNMLIAGVDDAGRGAVIGPLVIAGVMTKQENLPKLAQLGVKDSKLLTPHRRETLAAQIKQTVEKYVIAKLSPQEIDDVVENGVKLHKLNRLEAQTMAKVIETLKPDKAYVDASDILEERYKHHILECLTFKIEIVSEHKADRNYPIVSAASIIAKVERDKTITDLAYTHGDFGSGYPSDPKTIDYLKNYLQKHVQYPDFVRKSWKPAKKVLSERNSPRQTRLT